MVCNTPPVPRPCPGPVSPHRPAAALPASFPASRQRALWLGKRANYRKQKTGSKFTGLWATCVPPLTQESTPQELTWRVSTWVLADL